MDSANCVWRLYQTPGSPQWVCVHLVITMIMIFQRLHIYLLSAKILGQLCGKSSVQQIDLARFQRGVHIRVHVKTTEGCVYQEEHMFVFVLRIKQDCRDTRLVLNVEVVAVGGTEIL